MYEDLAEIIIIIIIINININCDIFASLLSRTTRYTDVELPNHGKKCEDRCSHFLKNE